MSQLSQRLLNNLEEYYDQITLMWEDLLSVEQMAERLHLPEQDVIDMNLVIFNLYPIVYATNLFGQKVCLKYDAHTLQFKEIEDVTKKL